MTDTARQVPNWGAFKGIKAKCANGPVEASKGREDVSISEPSYSNAQSHSPAFDVSASMADSEIFYASGHVGDRTEEEFDELGEGAIRQIGRNFISLVGVASSAAFLAAVVLWSIPNDSITVADVKNADKTLISDEGVVGVAAGQEFYVGESALHRRAKADEVKQFIDVDVTLPIPSVLAEAKEGTSANVSTVMEYAGLPGPAPFPRALAMASLESLEDGPLAQGSDDEASARINQETQTSKWVSVMIPRARPSF